MTTPPHPLGWPERPRAGSQFDSVLEEFTVEDAELVVDALRQRAGNLVESNPVIEAWQEPNVPDQLRLIANHLAMEVGKTRTLSVKRTPARQAYMGFDQ